MRYLSRHLSVLVLLQGLGLTRVFATQADQERAASAIEQAVKADPNNSELWTHLGFAYRKEGKLDDAISAFQKTVALNPRATDALYMLGLIYESKHQASQAKDAWTQYLAVETDGAKRAVAENHLHHLNQ